MRIVVDSDIWGVGSLFSTLGDVVPLPGREINSTAVRSADALIVRSVTRVDESILTGSSVRFVGTATSGTDHVQRDFLTRHGIVIADAAGCNARPVVEYVLSCLFEWQHRTGRPLIGSVLGVIGRGRIGRGVADWGTALGMNVLAADPPLENAGQSGLCSIDQLLNASDIVTLHVPLTHDGENATHGLMNARRLDQMKRGACLINAARGRVVVDADLIAAVDAGQLGGAMLDVWSGEPVASPGLLQAASLITPHIAGYSAAAHRRASERIAVQLSNWIRGRDERSISSSEPLLNDAKLHPVRGSADLLVIENLVRQVCDVSAIDSEYRQNLKTVAAPDAFDAVRSRCRLRRELKDMEFNDQTCSTAVRDLLKAWSDSRDDHPCLG